MIFAKILFSAVIILSVYFFFYSLFDSFETEIKFKKVDLVTAFYFLLCIAATVIIACIS